MANAIFVCICLFTLLWALLSMFDVDDVTLPPVPEGMFLFTANNTQGVLIEGRKAEERMMLAAQAKREQGSDARSLTLYGLAFMKGDEVLEGVVDYVTSFFEGRKDAHHSLHETSSTSLAWEEGPVHTHVLMAADNGTKYGIHELMYVYASMRYRTPITIAGCVEAFFGFFERPARDSLSATVLTDKQRKTPVLAVVSGSSVTSAGRCADAVMRLPMLSVHSLTFIGTSAVSPVLGGGGWQPAATDMDRLSISAAGGEGATVSGIEGKQERPLSMEALDVEQNPTCQQEWSATSTKVALGSVCVTHEAFLQECGLCLEDTHVPSLCARPRCELHNASYFSGPCIFLHPASQVAEAMKGGMYRKPFPAVPKEVAEGMRRYWQANEALPAYRPVEVIDDMVSVKEVKKMGASTRKRAPSFWYEYARQPPTSPTLLHCAESSIGVVTEGPRHDVACRTYTEEALNKSFAPQSIACVQAAEGAGLLHVMTRLYPHVPVSIVRGAARYTMRPLRKVVYPISSDESPLLPRSQYLDARARAIENSKESQETKRTGQTENTEEAAAVMCRAAAEGDVSGCVAETTPTSVAEASDLLHTLLTANEDSETVAKAAQKLFGDEAGEAVAHPGASSIRRRKMVEYVRWEQKAKNVPWAKRVAFEREAHRYAIETASAVVLNYFLNSARSFAGDLM